MSDRFTLPPRKDGRSSIREWLEDIVGMICLMVIFIGSFIMLGVVLANRPDPRRGRPKGARHDD
jgi:hypothetical protein